VHTLFDGDTVFGLSTARVEPSAPAGDALAAAMELTEVYAAAADTLTRAIVHALLAAESIGDVRSYRDAYVSQA
jgi:putative pantetheine hydrolase